MTTIVTKIYDSRAGKTADFTDGNSVASYINGLDPVASDVMYQIRCRSDIALPTTGVGPTSSSDTQRVVLMPDTGYGVNELSVSTLDYNATVGVKLYAANAYGDFNLTSGLDITGFNIPQGSGQGTFTTKYNHSSNTYDNLITRNRFYITVGGINLGSGPNNTLLTDNLIITESTATLMNDKWNTKSARNTYVARGAAKGVATAISRDYGMNNTSENDVFIGFGGTIVNNMPVTNAYSNTTPTGGNTSGFTVNTTAGALVVSETNDFRPTASGGLIGKANSTAVSTLDILLNNRGSAPDAGAWQRTPATSLPTGSITTITVSGQTVTVSGTTTGTPTSGTVSLSPTNTAYNSGTMQGPIAATFGTNTFSATFTNVPVGQYSPTATLTNSGGTQAAVNNAGNANVTGAQGTLSSQSLDGQNLTLTGTTTGNPTSATILVPAAATNPNGAVSVGPTAVTLGSGTFTVTVALTPGNYDPSIVRFTNAAGTSLPMSGPTAVTVASVQGNPSAPNNTDTTAPVMNGALTNSNILATGYTLNWPAASDNVAVTGYEVSTDGGTTYTDVGNVLTRVITGKSQNTTYNNRVRAYDASGNRATPLSNTATTQTASDTTAPVMQGSLTSSNVTQTGYTLTWQAATDDTGVTGYEVSTDGGSTYVDVGNVLTKAITGKTAGTTYGNRVRAYDAAGNRATPLSNSVTTSAAQDTTPPVMQGTLTSSNVTQTGYTLTWQAATDDVGVTGYEVSTDAGTTYTDVGNVLTRAVSGKTTSTTYNNRVRAYDAAGNRATPLSNSVTTASPGTSTASTSVILTVAIGAQYRANLQGMQWYWYDKLSPFGTPVDQGDASAINALGQLAINMPDSTKGSGDLGWLVVTDLDDRTGIPFKVFSGVVRIN